MKLKDSVVNFRALAGLMMALSGPAGAANYYVSVNGSAFSPATVIIQAGDTVTWENTDDFFPHTTTSDLSISSPNYWGYLLVGQGDTCDVTFNSVGTFTYHDELDSGTGTIIVNAAAPANIVLGAARRAGSQFVFDVTGLTVGKTNVLQGSTNLTSWAAIQTNVASASALTLSNAITLPRRFYRLAELP